MPGNIFLIVSAMNTLEHRLTKVSHPWTNGQVERMTRTLKETTVKKSDPPTSQTTSLSLCKDL